MRKDGNSWSNFERMAWVIAFIIAFAVAGGFAWKRMSAPTLASVIEYAMLEPRDTPTALAIGPDGTVWFTIDFAAAVGRVRDGKVERLPKPRTSLEPVGIAVTNDGAAWYTDSESRQISRMAPSGDISSITLDTPVARLGKVAAAVDGSVWFAEATAYSITRVKDGRLQRHVIDSLRGGPLGVAVSSDGTVWATLQAANQLLQIAADGKMSTFDIPTRGSSPADIAVGVDDPYLVAGRSASGSARGSIASIQGIILDSHASAAIFKRSVGGGVVDHVELRFVIEDGSLSIGVGKECRARGQRQMNE